MAPFVGRQAGAQGASRVITLWSPRAIEVHLTHLRSYIAHDNPSAANRIARELEPFSLCCRGPDNGIGPNVPRSLSVLRHAEVRTALVKAVEPLDGLLNAGRPGRIAGSRELVVAGTPYVIPYRLRIDWLEIIAVFHGGQKWPTYL